MRVRYITNSAPKWSVARDYIESVKDRKRTDARDVRPKGRSAEQVLKVFEDGNKPVLADSAPPVEGLIRVLTHDMQGMPGLLVYGDGKEIGVRLFKGCRVKLVGVPRRRFVVDDIFWDRESVRLRELGNDTEYVMPWDFVQFLDE